ncbi:hypothetical protein PBNK5_11220 [Pectobacterium brasiliense]
MVRRQGNVASCIGYGKRKFAWDSVAVLKTVAGELQHGGAPYRDSGGCGIIIEEAERNYFPNAVRIMLLTVNLRALGTETR